MQIIHKLVLATAVLTVVNDGGSAQQTCRFDKAIYRPIDESRVGRTTNYSLTHSRKDVGPNNAYLAMTISAQSKESGAKAQSHDFSFSFSNGYGRTFVSLAQGKERRLSKRNEAVGSVIL